MANVRLIPRLDIKGPNLIKGIHLEGLRVIGNPNFHARKYYEDGADELIYMDCVASLYGRNSLSELVKESAKGIFIPMTVGGGIRSSSDVEELLRCGADKVAVNTAAVNDPKIINEISRDFGSQCLVVSIEAKTIGNDKWEALTDNGRERTGRDVLEWVAEVVQRGAGEILLTSIDMEGTRKGYDDGLISKVVEIASIPVITSGGMGTTDHAIDCIKKTKVNAISMADVLHYERLKISEIRGKISDAGLPVRKVLL